MEPIAPNTGNSWKPSGKPWKWMGNPWKLLKFPQLIRICFGSGDIRLQPPFEPWCMRGWMHSDSACERSVPGCYALDFIVEVAEETMKERSTFAALRAENPLTRLQPRKSQRTCRFLSQGVDLLMVVCGFFGLIPTTSQLNWLVVLQLNWG